MNPQHLPRIRRVRTARTAERPPVATQERIDRVLSSLHKRKEAQISEIAAFLATHPVIVGPILQYMQALNWVAETVHTNEGTTISIWKLTFSGAKEAVFALHRARSTGARTTFVGGVNPWTGVRTRQLHKSD